MMAERLEPVIRENASNTGYGRTPALFEAINLSVGTAVHVQDPLVGR